MMTDENNDLEILSVRPASEEEAFYVGLGAHIVKETLPTLNQILRQLVTLSAALLAGAIAVSDKQIVGRGFILIAVVSLLMSLVAALGGMLPFHAEMPRDEPYTIRDIVMNAQRWKTRTVCVSGFLLALAMMVLLIGVIAQPS
jgi:hypothetical protein